MSTLPGNPHAESAIPLGDVAFSADGSPMQATEVLLSDLKHAVLALAHEQRTATLVAWSQHLARTSRASRGVDAEVSRRLGRTDA